MTKKDFITVSSVIKYTSGQCYEGETVFGYITRLSTNMANEFASINPRFDYDKFYEACGITK